MRNPKLNPYTLSELISDIKLTNSIVTEVKRSDLEKLLLYIEQERAENELTAFRLNLANPGRNFKASDFNSHLGHDEVEKLVKAEIEKRAGSSARQKPGISEITNTLYPAFISLFKSEEKARIALKAAIDSGIIFETGHPALRKRKMVPAIIQYWDAISDIKFDLTHIRSEKEAIAETCLHQCEVIAEQFGAKIGKTAIYDNAGKRKGTHFTRVFKILAGQ